MRDYSRQLVPIFQGENGKNAYIRMLKAKTMPSKYNRQEAQKKARNDLKKRGFDV